MLKRLRKKPPVPAALVFDREGGGLTVFPDGPGWLEAARPLLESAPRAGLRVPGRPVVWLVGPPFRFFYRTVGRISSAGHVQERFACLTNGRVTLWASEDGTISVHSGEPR